MFTTEAQKACFEKVVGYVREMFGENVTAADGAPLLSVVAGSALVFVSVDPLHDNDDAIVTVRAIVVTHATITPELALFLLQANTTTMFGAFGIRPTGDIVLEHNLIGSTLSKEELEVSLFTIARVADRVDEEIVARWGGQRALDRVDGLARLLDFEPEKTQSH